MNGKVMVLLGIVAIVAIVYFIGGFPAQSLVSISDITLKDGGQRILVSMVVDQTQQRFYAIEPFQKDLGSGRTYQTRTTGVVVFKPKQNVCSYSLTRVSKNIVPFLYDAVYYVPNSTLPTTPFDVELRRGQLSSTNPNDYPLVTSVSFDASIATKDISTPFGTVTISDLGKLQTGYTCPSTTFAIINEGGNYKVVNLASYEQKLNNILPFCLLNPLTCGYAIFSQVSEDYTLNKCVGSCPMGYDPNNLSSAVNAMKFNYNMSRSYAPVVTASFDKAFVDAVIVEPVVIQPRITTTNTTSSIKKQESFTFIATFYNDYSEEATFFVSTSSNNNGVAINPQVVNVTVPAMSNRQVSFVGTGLTAGASQICVTATSQSQFGGSKSAQSCFNVRVTEEVLPAHCGNNICEAILGETVANCPSDCKPSSCGNGVCDNGENTITCPSDCGTPVVCDYPLVPYKKENFSLFGQWGTGVLGTGFLGSVIETGCTLDPIIIVLGFVFLIVVVLAIAKMARWI